MYILFLLLLRQLHNSVNRVNVFLKSEAKLHTPSNSVSKCYEILQIYENERDYGVYCENSIVPMITSASNILFVEYKTDSLRVDPGSGFNAEYNLREGKIFTLALKRHLYFAADDSFKFCRFFLKNNQ